MNKRGSSTVYLMLIMAGLIGMGLIFIDITRIVVAENHVKRAAKTAENSVLAGYSRQNAISYGIFGEPSTVDTRKAIFLYYFKRNLSNGQSRLGLSYEINTKALEIEVLQNFMDDEVLKSQMISSVKYKKPGEWIKSIADIFDGKEIETLKEKNQEARNDREKKKELKRKLSELKNQLKEVKDDGKEALLDEIKNISGIIDDIDGAMKGKSNSEVKLSDVQTAKDFFIGKLNEITGIRNCTIPEEYYPVSLEIDNSDGFNGYEGAMNSEEGRETVNQSALIVIKDFGKGIKDAATGSVDKLFLAEYVIDRFSSLINEKEGHFYKKGEIEHIISGGRNTTELAAISITAMKMWTIRFAINFIVDISNSLIPEPVERLAYSLMTAGIEASTDLVKLTTGFKVPALPKCLKKIELSYEDHLRLLLYMKSEKQLVDGTRLMVNCSSISQGGPGMAEMGTFFRVKYETSIDLLFIPLLKPELLSERFKGGKYVIEREEFFGY